MATSNSKGRGAERPARWVGRASIFSGRPDPQWVVPDDLARRLIAFWDRLPPESSVHTEPTDLGYRSCSLSSKDGRRWVAFGCVVRLDLQERVEFRRDDGGAFERELLASAPEGLLPWSRGVS